MPAQLPIDGDGGVGPYGEPGAKERRRGARKKPSSLAERLNGRAQKKNHRALHTTTMRPFRVLLVASAAGLACATTCPNTAAHGIRSCSPALSANCTFCTCVPQKALAPHATLYASRLWALKLTQAHTQHPTGSQAPFKANNSSNFQREARNASCRRSKNIAWSASTCTARAS